MFYIQVITNNCFQELDPFKLTCILGPIVPYGNEFHNLTYYGVDKYLLLGDFLQVPMFFPLQEIVNGVPEHLSPCCS